MVMRAIHISDFLFFSCCQQLEVIERKSDVFSTRRLRHLRDIENQIMFHSAIERKLQPLLKI